VTTTGIPHLDIESLDQFDLIMAAGATSMAGWRVQSAILTARTSELLKLAPMGSLFLGCTLDEAASDWIQDGGGLIFPTIPRGCTTTRSRTLSPNFRTANPGSALWAATGSR
jgi:hypothetical protein